MKIISIKSIFFKLDSVIFFKFANAKDILLTQFEVSFCRNMLSGLSSSIFIHQFISRLGATIDTSIGNTAG